METKVQNVARKITPTCQDGSVPSDIQLLLRSSNVSPLSVPILSGLFTRVVTEELLNGALQKKVTYSTTNKVKLGDYLFCQDVKKLHNYLLQKKIKISIDYFSFNPNTNTSLTYQGEFWKSVTVIEDFSEGKEFFPVAVINSIDNEVPHLDQYITSNIFSEDIGENTDKGLSWFCCGCEDDCKNKLTCPCFQLTLANFDLEERKKTDDENIGYDYKTLESERQTKSGIFECNAHCKCKLSCLNRVVQNGSKWRLQIFKTVNKGWGVRTLNDIPNGAFVSNYNGVIFEDSSFIPVGIICKNWRSNDQWKYHLDLGVTQNVIKLHFRKNFRQCDQNNNLEVWSPKSCFCTLMNAKPIIHRKIHPPRSRKPSMRFGRGKEATKIPDIKKNYFMDGKVHGNLGRFFNHSCDPNMFPQYVFVDSHDLRFPWVSFFAAKDIRAGDELTWSYNYQFDSKSTHIECECGSDNCTRRFC